MTVIYIIYPDDITTSFLLEIPERISKKNGEQSFRLLKVHANDKSYSDALIEIESIPTGSVILFMGHGQDDKLWGAESESFTKKSFINKTQSKIFAEKSVFLLSCNSNEFLKGTFSFSKVVGSIGFGNLPSEMSEVKTSKHLQRQGVNENVLNMYKQIIVELVSISFSEMIQHTQSFAQLSSCFILRLNKKISQVILSDPKNSDHRILSDLLFQMKAEMIFI